MNDAEKHCGSCAFLRHQRAVRILTELSNLGVDKDVLANVHTLWDEIIPTRHTVER